MRERERKRHPPKEDATPQASGGLAKKKTAVGAKPDLHAKHTNERSGTKRVRAEGVVAVASHRPKPNRKRKNQGEKKAAK
jgi:hypothetical protein